MLMVLPFVYEPLPIADLGLQAFMAICAFVAGLCVIAAYKMGDAAVVAPMQYSQLIWAAIYGAIFFDEHTDRNTWIGAGIIMASGLYIVLRETFGGNSDTRPVLQSRIRPETGTSPRSSRHLLPPGAVVTRDDPLAKPRKSR